MFAISNLGSDVNGFSASWSQQSQRALGVPDNEPEKCLCEVAAGESKNALLPC
jgi:hypothetical protein